MGGCSSLLFAGVLLQSQSGPRLWWGWGETGTEYDHRMGIGNREQQGGDETRYPVVACIL